MNTRTLPIDESPAGSAARTDHLYLVLAGGKPGGGARWSLAGIDKVEIGRGAARKVTRTGPTMRLDCPDPYMSSSHLRVRARARALGRRRRRLAQRHPRRRRQAGPRDRHRARRRRGRAQLLHAARGRARRPGRARLAGGDPLATLDPELAARFDELRRIAQSDVPVLVGGPTGTGKERVAQAIHTLSRRTRRVRAGQLRRAARVARRERAVRPQQGRVLGRGRRRARASSSPRRRHAVPRRDRRPARAGAGRAAARARGARGAPGRRDRR